MFLAKKAPFGVFRLYNITMGPLVKGPKDPSGTLDSIWEVQTSMIGLEYVLLGVAVFPPPPPVPIISGAHLVLHSLPTFLFSILCINCQSFFP